MTSPAHRLASLALALIGLSASACTGDALDPTQSVEIESEPLRLGRVHVVLEPEAELADGFEDEAPEALEVTARFAFVRGLEEDFVRARINMPVLPADILAPSTCTVAQQLDPALSVEHQGTELRELHLVDAGDLKLQIGGDPDRILEIPLSLVPDLLPYMSGFEYLYYGDELPIGFSEGEDAALIVEAKGSQTEELPPFRAESAIPPELALYVTEADLTELAADALVLRWKRGFATSDGDDLLTMSIAGLHRGEPVGAELVCVVSDVGQVRLSLEQLRFLGLRTDGEALRVMVSRLEANAFDAGDFVGSELLVERRERLLLPLL